MNKKQIIKALEQIAIYLELKGENPFKISAYRKAAMALENDDRSMAQIEEPGKLKGIGKGTAQVIHELLETGESALLNQLKEEVPEGVLTLLKLPGLGGKKIAKLYQTLGVIDLETLKQACIDEKVQTLEGFGKKTEEKILKAVEESTQKPERLPIDYMVKLSVMIENVLTEIPQIQRFSRAGSLRRLREMIKDLDFVIATEAPMEVAESIKEKLAVQEIIGQGETKMSIMLNDEYGVSVDFRFVAEAEFATALHHFTGSKDHNVKMRQLAKSRGEKISEYGVEQEETGEVITFSSEEAFFNHFGLCTIPPEIRVGKEEVDIAATLSDFPFIEENHIKADLHMHSTYSDGAYTIEEMAEAAIKKGYEYIVITDHSKSLRVAGGLDEQRLIDQRMEIDRLNQSYGKTFKIFAGTEMDILADGRLDFENETLKTLDFVIAAIHTSFSQEEATIMHRLRQAMENPYVRLIAHPTGRIIGRRKGYPVNMEMLINMAHETGTALELNANPTRLDLASEWVRKAQEHHVKIAINTDAHSLDMLDDMPTGVAAARKGWIEPQTVLNTMDRASFEAFISTPKQGHL
ncbi:DNA polymerase (family 10) [Pullulanibacillus pueri]|uniref:DNA-directed DNA polymerase n=1 Tax=Pullulanibacillus pueri TaxID=1437324 RepID=A0A8J3EMQ2_9BACL|nr:DNA polymerase/3'-5' exonuclease PolX [Pullulanibacillus pueri]MBM7682009.1 DNA polymerase (family 10) [Pullulanibacillus pueri]GGH83739.1 DNA polymerase/3'-5' exonuclease PolX [Pullulanibacillus pueri]